MHGWTRAMQGEGPQAVTQIRQYLTELRATGTRQIIPYFLGLLAEACVQAGMTEAGFAAVAEAFAIVGQTGEHCHEAELYHLKGELLLQVSAQRLEDKVSPADPTPQPPHAEEAVWSTVTPNRYTSITWKALPKANCVPPAGGSGT